MDSVITLLMAALNPLHDLVLKLWGYLPSIVTALVLLLVGSFLARYGRIMMMRLMDILHVDEYARRIEAHHVLQRLGLGSSLTKVSGIVVFAVIMVAFLMASANAVGLSIVDEFLRRFLGFMPRLIAVVMVMGGGLYLGSLIERIVYRSANANHIRGSEALSRGTYGLMVLFSGFMALQILGIDTGILFQSMRIIIASVGLGCAIAFGVAFGMAGRDAAGRWIHDLTPKHDNHRTGRKKARA